MDDNLRNVAKAIQFGVLYGAGPDVIATMIERSRTKETRDMKKKMIKHRGRIHLKPEQVFHFGPSGSANYACFVCGAPADHQVRATNDGSTGYKQGDLYLCNRHFVQIFSLPPNRHPKKAKPKVEVKTEKQKALEERMADRQYTLRRFMQSPLTFNGRRVICHTVSIAHTDWYFSLYFNSDEEEYVVSIARVIKYKSGSMAINLVKDTIKNLGLIQVPVLELLNATEGFVPMEKDVLKEHIRVQNAATEFIEQVVAYR